MTPNKESDKAEPAPSGVLRYPVAASHRVIWPDIPRVVLPAITLVHVISRILFFGAVRITRHGFEGKRFDGCTGSGKWTAVFCVAGGAKDEAAFPALRQRRQTAGVEAGRDLFAGPDDHIVVIEGL